MVMLCARGSHIGSKDTHRTYVLRCCIACLRLAARMQKSTGVINTNFEAQPHRRDTCTHTATLVPRPRGSYAVEIFDHTLG